MQPARPIDLPRRTDPAVRLVGSSWRRLTGGSGVRDPQRRTLIACSGGADSSALAVLLAAAAGDHAPTSLVVAHIRHDLRPPEQTEPDEAAVGSLAEAIGVPFVRAEVAVRELEGNAEGNARRARYRALGVLARAAGCAYVATGHHADDQLESVLMAVVRGAGASGLRGVHESRAFGRLRVIRPMLGLTRAQCREVCARAGVEWREDQTNADAALLRGALRSRVVPALAEIRPSAADRATAMAALMADVAGLLEDRARALLGDALPRGDDSERTCSLTWPRERLRRERVVVLGEVVRTAAGVIAGRARRDSLSAASLTQIARMIRDSHVEPRTRILGPVEVIITAREFSVVRRQDPALDDQKSRSGVS